MDLLNKEKNLFFEKNFNSSLIIRPLINNKNKKFEIHFSNQFVNNSGHPNIDNSGIFNAIDGKTNMVSYTYLINTKYMFVKFSPYRLQRNIKKPDYHKFVNPFAYLNNSIDYQNYDKINFGLNESLLLIHYNGIGFSIGNMSNWWGPGFHSTTGISSNSSNFYSTQFGTYSPLRINKISLQFRFLATELNNSYNNNYFLTGSVFSLGYISNPTINIGFIRYFLSGGFDNIENITGLDKEWQMEDAIGLIFEPLFGQNKTGLDYTNINSPGYDKWDQIITGFGELIFPENNLKLYFELSSDDNRSNLSDLIAHWDHTLGYVFGFRQYFFYGKRVIFIGFEHLSTKVSNTMKFWRGDINQPNYYTRKEYDFSSYNGRRYGAHSGSSSDDSILMLGIGDDQSFAQLSFNIERHGIKSKLYPEIKNEFSFIYQTKIAASHSLFIKYEHEKINHYYFINNNKSISNYLWLGYTYSIR